MTGTTRDEPGSGPRPRTLSIVIPAYNEEARLPTLLHTLSTRAEDDVEAGGFELLEVLVVDDGSTDRTREMLTDASRAGSTIRPVLDLDSNQGKGGAIAAGVARARGDFVLLADVDLSTPLDELAKLSRGIDSGADLAVGSRAIAGAIVERGPAYRKLMGKSFNATVRALTGLSLRDTQCGFKLIPTEAGKELLRGQTCSGFAFDVELLMRAKAAGMRIAEIPVVYVHDPQSRVRVVGATMEMLREVAGLSYRLRVRDRRAPGAPGEGSLGGLPADNPD